MRQTFLLGRQELITEPVPMGELQRGDVFVSEQTAQGRAVYRVTQPCSENEQGWLFVIDARDPDSEGGFFSYPHTTPMNKVIKIREV